jgi:hypothetical protein
MNKLFLFGASILVLAGCNTTNNSGLGDYGYTYDMELPTVSGSQAQLTAALDNRPTDYALIDQSQSQHPASQSVVFYEGAQPPRGAVAAGTPVWTSPVAGTPPPAYVPGAPGAPVVNEPAGAGVAAGAAPAAAEPGVPYYYGDGGSATIFPSNGVTAGTNGGGINISNSNIVGIGTNFFTNTSTNITGTNITTTNITGTNLPMTNVVMTNGNQLLRSNGVITNFAATPTNPVVTTNPLVLATNDLNNLSRATNSLVGNPPGTPLVTNRALGQGPTPAQSQNLTTTPTQPGPINEAAGASAGTGTTTQTPAQGATGTTTANGLGGTLGPRTILTPQQQAVQQQQLQQRQQQQQQAQPARPMTRPARPQAAPTTP